MIGEEGFHCTGLMVTERNFLDIYPFWKWDTKTIPNFKEGEEIVPDFIRMDEGVTTPPPLLKEPDLVALMDKNGIGTDATIAEHINKIQERKYAVIDGLEFKPTTLGEAIIAGYNFIGLRILSQPNLRAKTESDMKDITSQKKDKNQVLSENIQMYRVIFQGINAEAAKLDKALSRYFSPITGKNKAPSHNNNNNFDDSPRTNYPSNGPFNPTNNQAKSNFGNTNSSHNNQNDTDDDPQCNCGVPAVRAVVRKQNENQGRPFFSCGNNRTCNFFKWADTDDSNTTKNSYENSKV
jgi:DNA topoisomerase-3